MKCRLDNFSMGFILFYENLSNCEKKIAINMREQFSKAPYDHLIKKINIFNIPLSENEEYDI